MKSIYLIHASLILLIAIVITFINNQYYYKSIEKSAYRTMKLETNQLKATLQECYQSKHTNCDNYADSFLSASNISGKIHLIKDNKTLVNIDLEDYKDDRSATEYNENFSVNGHNYSILYSEMTTPPILKSVFRSMTFSIFEWYDAGKNGNGKFLENIKTFISETALPRSMPALNYTIFMLMLFYACWQLYLFAIRTNWERYEAIILDRNLSIENLQKELERGTQEQNENKNKQLQLSQKIDELIEEKQDLINKKAEYEALTQDLGEKIKLEKQKYNEQIKYNVGALEAELLSATKKYKDEKDQLIEMQKNIEEKYQKDLQTIDIESNAKIDIYEDQLDQLKNSLEALNKHQEELTLDYEISQEELNHHLKLIEEKENIVGKLENEILQLTEQRNEKMEDQSSLISNNTKKLISKYLISNPHLKNPTYSDDIKLSVKDHHGNNLVTKIHKYICNHKELAKIVRTVTSCDNERGSQRKVIFVRHIPRHGTDNQNYKYIAEVVPESDEGYAIELLLNASSDWEAIVQAKMLLLYVKQLKDFTIIDKLAT